MNESNGGRSAVIGLDQPLDFGRLDLPDEGRDGVGRPLAPDDGVGRFFGGVTRLLAIG